MPTDVIDIERAYAIPSPYMSRAELTWLAEQAQACQVIIEIGCGFGRSTRALADHCPGTVYAVDNWEGGEAFRYDRFCEELADHLASGRVVKRKQDSLLAGRELRRTRVLADLIFIDANHEYAHVAGDIAIWIHLVKPGGLLCGHDYWPNSHPGVRQAVDEAFGSDVMHHADSIWAVRL